MGDKTKEVKVGGGAKDAQMLLAAPPPRPSLRLSPVLLTPQNAKPKNPGSRREAQGDAHWV